MKRQAPANDSPSFAEIAVLCGDNIDANPNTTTKDIFENIVSASRNISHMCTHSRFVRLRSGLKLMRTARHSRRGIPRRSVLLLGLAIACRRAV